MNCTYFQIVVHEVARETSMDTASWNDAVAHAAGCCECARWLVEARSLAADVGVWARAAVREQAPPALEARLIEAFRREQKLRTTWRRRRRWAEWAIAAAAVLALAGVAVMRRHDMLRRRNLGATTVHPGPTVVQAPPVAAPSAEHPATAFRHEPAHDVASQSGNSIRRRAQADAPEVATDFLPLPGAEGSEDLDSGELVRVELPRSALAYLGFPGAVDSGGGTVTADVLIGENGLAQAVRFVQ